MQVLSNNHIMLRTQFQSDASDAPQDARVLVQKAESGGVYGVGDAYGYEPGHVQKEFGGPRGGGGSAGSRS